MDLFQAVPTGAIEVLDGADRPYFKRADLGRFLGISDIRHTFGNVVTKSRFQLTEPGGGLTPSRSGMLGGGKNPHDAFVDLEAALEIVVRSKKPKAVELVKWLTRKGVEKVVEEKQLAIKAKDAAIEQKDAQLALVNDDLVESQGRVMQLQVQLEELQSRAVSPLANNSKMNGIAVIQKNNGDAYPYVAICGQQGYVAQKIRNKLADYPNGQLVVLGETGNAIVHYNWLRERGCIEVNPDRVRHFRLGQHYTHQQLIELQEA